MLFPFIPLRNFFHTRSLTTWSDITNQENLDSVNDITVFANKIICGDCTSVMRNMPTESVDFIVTDPPYIASYRSRDGRRVRNDDNHEWLEPAFTQMYRVLKRNRFCVSFYGWHKVGHFMRAWRRAGLRPVGHFTFVKDYASKQGYTRNHHEVAYLLAKGNPPQPAAAPQDVVPWRYTGNRLHPTQKPIEAMLPLIRAYSSPGDIVLDPFIGSGTTAVAAQKLGRQYIGIELDEQYCTAARSRMNHYQVLTKTNRMGYIQDIEQKIRKLLAEGDDDVTIAYIKDQLLKSYRNGILSVKFPKAGKEAEQETQAIAR